MEIVRRKTRAVKVGGLTLGNGGRIAVQSMANARSQNFYLSNKEENIENIRFLEMKAEYLPLFIKEKTICEIYLNFSTPYPKSRHESHRLTYKDFLEIYKKLLVDDGFIAQKTDSKGFFEYSLESFSQNGFVLSEISLDLHNSDFEGNIVTEYEQKFVDMGLPIHRLVARLK